MNKIDPKECNVPNINFSIYNEGDTREEAFRKERLKQGFDQSETWSLDCTIAAFIIPRLKEYKKIVLNFFAYPKDDDFYINIDKMIKAFELIIRNDGNRIWNEKEQQQVEEGLKLFSENLLSLWW